MFMRMLQMKVDPARMPDLRAYYDGRVIPTLNQTPGCMFAGLIQSNEHEGECLSMTLWQSAEDAERYGRSATYTEMVDEVRSFLAESSEWKIQLSKDMTLETVPVPEEPVLKSYDLTSATADRLNDSAVPRALYVRVVNPSVREGQEAEFRRIYSEQVIPVLRNVEGCRYAFLSEGAGGKHDIISVTIWDSTQAAADYEASELFRNIVLSLKHTFTDLFQWKIGLEESRMKNVVTSEDSSVGHYKVVSGAKFEDQ